MKVVALTHSDQTKQTLIHALLPRGVPVVHFDSVEELYKESSKHPLLLMIDDRYFSHQQILMYLKLLKNSYYQKVQKAVVLSQSLYEHQIDDYLNNGFDKVFNSRLHPKIVAGMLYSYIKEVKDDNKKIYTMVKPTENTHLNVYSAFFKNYISGNITHCSLLGMAVKFDKINLRKLIFDENVTQPDEKLMYTDATIIIGDLSIKTDLSLNKIKDNIAAFSFENLDEATSNQLAEYIYQKIQEKSSEN